MAGFMNKIGYKVLVAAFAAPTGFAIKKGLDTVWRKARGSEPPKGQTDARLADAIAWTAASAAAIAIGQLIAVRGASAAFRALTGQEPPLEKSEKTKDHQSPDAKSDAGKKEKSPSPA